MLYSTMRSYGTERVLTWSEPSFPPVNNSTSSSSPDGETTLLRIGPLWACREATQSKEEFQRCRRCTRSEPSIAMILLSANGADCERRKRKGETYDDSAICRRAVQIGAVARERQDRRLWERDNDSISRCTAKEGREAREMGKPHARQ
jgi:hypothetical protein